MLRKILLLAAVFAVALGATLFYLSRPASSARLASWDGPRVGTGDARYRPASVSGSEVRVGEADLNTLVRRALEDSEDGRRALDLSKELRTEIVEGRVEIGVVINLSEIPPEELTDEERAHIAQVTRFLPFLGEQDLYIGVSGVPVARDGQVTVDRDVKVKLAFLSLPIDEMGELFGVDTAPFRQELFLDLSPFKAREVEVRQGEVLIRLAV